MHPSLAIQHIEGLPEPTKSLARLAASSTVLAHLVKLDDLISHTSHPQEALCIPAFYVHLNVRDLPLLRAQIRKLPKVSCLPERLACALVGLGAFGKLHGYVHPGAREEVWSSAWAWIQLLQEVNIKRAPELQPSSDAMRFVFVRVILAFSSQPKTCSSVMAQPQIREYMAAGWAAALNLPDVSQMLLADISTCVSANCDLANPDHLRDVVAGAGGTMNDLASLIVRGMRGLIPPPSTALADSLRLGLKIHGVLNLAHQLPPLKEALASHGIVGVICTALCAHALSGLSERDIAMLYLFTMSIVNYYLPVFPRNTRIKEALDSGLLRAIVFCACFKNVELFEKQLQELLGTLLPQALVYHSVLTSLRAALDDAEPLTHNRAFRESKLFGMWQDFVRLATDRLDLLVKFDRGKIGQTRACDNLECISPIKLDDDLKWCSRCHSTFYCSKTCQSQDWADHKTLCKSLLQRKNELAYLSPELKFLRAVLNHDYENARADVVAKHTKALEKHPNAPCAVVTFDYRQGVDVQIECGPALDEAEFTTQHYGARVGRSDRRLELHVMALTVGEDRTEWLALPMRVDAGGLVTTH
ncbi:hypothetical protein FB45DRAFT_932815 [Roridomyces roridus]|uniref:MYND-type domain-containing protein n=1 Tax=Roridomyces roridus TaxID=1738132 RepID=A0AAD7FFZ2_9AGAR|nr:hypothetical protein FB45DRAFT_932815 [Roridomyces roridus]